MKKYEIKKEKTCELRPLIFEYCPLFVMWYEDFKPTREMLDDIAQSIVKKNLEGFNLISYECNIVDDFCSQYKRILFKIIVERSESKIILYTITPKS